MFLFVFGVLMFHDFNGHLVYFFFRGFLGSLRDWIVSDVLYSSI